MSINVGVVGLGIGARHVESLERIAKARVAAVADLDKARVEEIAGRCGAVGFADWQSMLESDVPLDAVILATPAKVRREPIQAICDRGLALLCEKPPALSLEEAGDIEEIIARSGVLNTVGFMYRWNALATRMRELVAGRRLFFARSVTAWPILFGAVEGWLPKTLLTYEACGGPLIEQAIHYQDVLRYITGDEPLNVQGLSALGETVPLEGRDCPETTVYSMTHASGMLSTHIHNWSHKNTLIQMQLVGDGIDLTWQVEEGVWLRGTVDGEAIDESWDGNNYFEEIVGFVDAVEQGDQNLLRSTYADACRSLAVVQAATQAVASGETVTVPQGIAELVTEGI